LFWSFEHFIRTVIGLCILVAVIDQTPGPGAYDYRVSPLTRELTIGLPLKTSVNSVPPPNAYNINDGIGTSPSYRRTVPSWGVRSRSFVGSCYYDSVKAGVPGRLPLMLFFVTMYS